MRKVRFKGTITQGIGYFHCFSVGYEELNNGVAIFPVALVERKEDGQIIEVVADAITFLDKPEG